MTTTLTRQWLAWQVFGAFQYRVFIEAANRSSLIGTKVTRKHLIMAPFSKLSHLVTVAINTYSVSVKISNLP